jgi:hypothetical protein
VSQLYDQKDQCEAESNDLSAFNHPIFGSQAQRKEMRVGGDGEDGDPDEVRVEVGEHAWLGDFHVNVRASSSCSLTRPSYRTGGTSALTTTGAEKAVSYAHLQV